MKPLLLASATLFLCISATAQSDRQKLEIAPFAGFETGASAPVQFQVDPNTGQPLTTIDRTGVDKAVSYGAFIDYNKWENASLEFLWDRNPTSYTQHDFVAGHSFRAYNADIDQYQFGGLFHVLDSSHKLRPYIAAGLGFTHSSNSNSTGDTAFAWNVGGGAKYFMSRHFGLRGDLRLLSTYASSIQGQVCDPFFGCYTATQRNYFKRVNLGAGVVFRF